MPLTNLTGTAQVSGINYLPTGDGSSVIGWNLYNDSAAAPVDGVGGSATISWSSDTTNPLRKTSQFLLTKGASNSQGQGVSYDFAIDRADQAKIITVSADYRVSSGTYADGDLTFYIIDITNGTVIQPAGFTIPSITSPLSNKAIATFQTASNSTAYRLCIHVASVSASAYSVAFDNVQIGPQTVQYGAPVTDWVDAGTTTYNGAGVKTSTGLLDGGWTTNTTYTGKYRRVGDSLEVTGRVLLAGAPNSATLTITLPSGLSIDTTKLGSLTGGANDVGVGTCEDSGVRNYQKFTVDYNGSATSVRLVANAVSGTYLAGGPVTQAVPFTWGASDNLYFRFQVPILGWSSTVQMSNDTDTRVVAARYYQETNTTQSTYLDFPTKEIDTHNAVTVGSGTWKFTCPVPGLYKVSCRYSGAASATIRLYKNGSLFPSSNAAVVVDGNPTNGNGSGSTLVQLVAGDFIQLNTSSNALMNGHISIERLSGPSAIAASETVAVKARTNAGQALTGTPSAVAFADIEYSTHGSFSGSTFTAPISGKYRVSALVTLSVVTLSISQSLEVLLYKNGTLYNNLNTLYGNGGGANYRTGGSTTVSLLAGETVQIFAQTTIATTIYSGASNAGWPYTYVCIERIGN